MSKSETRHFNTVFAFIIGAFFVGVISCYVWQDAIHKSEIKGRDDRLITFQNELDRLALEAQAPELETDESQEVEETSELAIAFEPDGVFPDDLKAELSMKLIRPLEAYYEDKSLQPVSIHFSQSINSTGWDVLVIFSDSSYLNLSYGNRSAEDQPWWLPECLNKCTFTNTFDDDFPEITSQFKD